MFLRSIFRSHERFQQMLSEHLDGRLDPDGQARLQAHLAGCIQCQQAEAELRRVVAALRTVPMAPLPRSFALQRPPLPAPPLRPNRVFTPLGVMQGATAVSALALLTLVFADLAGYPPDRLSGPGRAVALDQAASQVAEGPPTQPAGETVAAMAAPAEEPVEMAATAEEPVDGQEAAAAGAPTSSLPEAKQLAPADGAAAAPPLPPATERSLSEWLLIASALATAILALTVTAWAWWLRRRASR